MITDKNPNKGKMPSKYMPSKEDINLINQVINDSVKNYGAGAYQTERTVKKVPKNKAKKAGLNGYLIASIGLSILLIGAYKVHNQPLEASNRYMKSKIYSYLDEADTPYSLPSNRFGQAQIVLTEDSDSLRRLVTTMMADGFTEHETYYAILSSCGEREVNKVCQAEGFNSFSDFLDHYYLDRGAGSVDVFENYVESGYIAQVNNVKKEERGNSLR